MDDWGRVLRGEEKNEGELWVVASRWYARNKPSGGGWMGMRARRGKGGRPTSNPGSTTQKNI